MGIMDFFRAKLGKAKEEEKNEKGAGERNLEELENWLLAKKQKEAEEERKIVSQISQFRSDLIKELKEEKGVIDRIDLKEKREQERIKLLVLEALSKYSGNLEKLIEELENLKEENIENFILQINSIFMDFEKKSHMNYEKATFLIGKELAAVRESIKLFFRKIDSALNKSFIENLKNINSSLEKIGEIKKEKMEKQEIAREIDELTGKIMEIEQKEGDAIKKIEKIKNSEEYIASKNMKEEALIKRRKLDEEILQLKKEIDFKSLKKEFHSDEKKMRVISEYEQDFEQVFEDKMILNFIENKKKDKIEAEINAIKMEKEKLEKNINGKDGIEEISKEAESLKRKKENLQEEKEKISKRMEKISDSIGCMKNELKKKWE